MEFQTHSKMSLEAMYDDLCRYTKVLKEGSEKEFIMFADGQISLMLKLKEEASINKELNIKIAELRAKNKKLQVELKHTKRSFIEEIEKFHNIEEENNTLEWQIALIKDFLSTNGIAIDNQAKEKLFQRSNATCPKVLNLGFRISPIEDSCGTIFDSDEPNSDLRASVSQRQKRKSKTQRRSSGDRTQRKKKSDEMEIPSEEIKEAFRMDLNNVPVERGVNFRRSSEPITSSPAMPTPKPVPRSDSDQVNSCTFRMHEYRNLPGNTPTGRYSNGGKLSRTHAFVSKVIIRTEKCFSCGKSLNFCRRALKCSDCRIMSHTECKDQCPLPCIPITCTSTKDIMDKGMLADYTSTTPPMIPSLIVQCVNEIESRGLKEIGLYRVSGSEQEVKDLKDKLLKRHNITLHQIEVPVLCGTIKYFLHHSLRDSIISCMMCHTFINAAAEHREEQLSLNLLSNAVWELPQPNKETLAFIILHLQRVAEAPDCKMPKENLAEVFGPTIVGYSDIEPTNSNILAETTQQEQVMRRLLSIPTDFWQNVLSLEVPELFHPHTKNYPSTSGK